MCPLKMLFLVHFMRDDLRSIFYESRICCKCVDRVRYEKLNLPSEDSLAEAKQACKTNTNARAKEAAFRKLVLWPSLSGTCY